MGKIINRKGRSKKKFIKKIKKRKGKIVEKNMVVGS